MIQQVESRLFRKGNKPVIINLTSKDIVGSNDIIEALKKKREVKEKNNGRNINKSSSND